MPRKSVSSSSKAQGLTNLPQNRFIRFIFRIYVKIFVPLLGWIFLGNPENYRMLWHYTKKIQSCEKAMVVFRREGFHVEFRSHFFGSATQIIAKPNHTTPATTPR